MSIEGWGWLYRHKTVMTDKQSILGFKKLSGEAITPVKSSPQSVGFDLASPRNAIIPPGSWITLFTDISIQLPPGTYGRVAPRSGLAALHRISVDAVVIDPDYTGNLCVVLINRSSKPFAICAGDRIAQLICEKAEYPVLREIRDLRATERGTKGFGSSGKKGGSPFRLKKASK